MQERSHPVQSISAVTLLTTDMRTSVVFYRDLGFETLYGDVDAEFTSFRAGSGFLNLQLDSDIQVTTVRQPRRSIWGRVVFWVDDVDKMYQRVLAAGYKAETQPADATWGERYFHVRDPNGHELSFAHPLSPG
jgi:catechol 2,3-dioxygenase-like lactoylglutathione lyase family enzyme